MSVFLLPFILSPAPPRLCLCCCCVFCFLYFVLFFVFLRLSWNSLCTPSCPPAQRSACLFLLNAGIKGVRHHCSHSTTVNKSTSSAPHASSTGSPLVLGRRAGQASGAGEQVSQQHFLLPVSEKWPGGGGVGLADHLWSSRVLRTAPVK